MAQRLSLVAAAGIAAFVLVFTGALATYTLIRAPRVSEVAPTAQTNGVTAAQPTPAPPLGSSFTQPQQPDQEQDAEVGETEESDDYTVSSEQAAGIALSIVPGASLLQQPRLVNVNGTAAYEVPLDRGNVYVDAASGQVLYGTASGSTQRPRRHDR